MSFDRFMQYIIDGKLDELQQLSMIVDIRSYFTNSKKCFYPSSIISDIGGNSREITCTPLQLACAYNRTNITVWLISKMNEMNFDHLTHSLIINTGDTKDHVGRTPLFLATLNQNIEIVNLLLQDTTIDVNLSVFIGNRELTALKMAIYKRGIEIVIALLKRGAHVDRNCLEGIARLDYPNELNWVRNLLQQAIQLLPQPVPTVQARELATVGIFATNTINNQGLQNQPLAPNVPPPTIQDTAPKPN